MNPRFPRAGRAAAAAALTFLALSPVLPASTGAASQQAKRVAVGDAAIDFTMQSIDGATYRLSDLRGEKTAILIFFRGTW